MTRVILVVEWPVLLTGVLLVVKTKGQLYTCAAAPTGPVASFLDGSCDCNANDIATVTGATSAQYCANQCQANSLCIAVQYYSGSCYLKKGCPPWAINVYGNGYNIYLRASCNVSNPLNGLATYAGNTNGDGTQQCFFGLCSVTYSCNSGYALIGSAATSCVASAAAGIANFSPSPPTCNQVYCAAPTSPGNGAASFSAGPPYAVGMTVTYSCNACFTLNGASTATCVQTTPNMPTCAWSATTPTCIANQCPNIFNQATGTIAAGPYYFNTNYMFTCNTNYAILPTGPTSMIYTCQCAGTWSSPFLVCQPTCPVLPNLPNGTVTVVGNTSTALGGQPFVGSVATFSCTPGHILVGATTSTCQNTCQWSASAPVCIPLTCNSTFFDNSGTVVSAPYDALSSYVFYCLTLNNSAAAWALPPPINATNVTYTCLVNGTWNTEFTSCQPTCPPAPAAPIVGTVAMAGVTSPPLGGLYFSGSTATYSCPPGLRPSSAPVITCLASGQWSGSAPSCEYCPTFSVVNGNVQYYSIPTRTAGSVAYWACNLGYISNGDDPVVCSSNATWTYLVQPTCTSLATQLQNASNSLPTFLPSLATGLSGGPIAAFHPNETDVIARASIIADALPYVLSGLTLAQIKELGYTLPDILIDCTFAGVVCKSSDIEYAQLDAQLGNCYTFNHKNMAVPYVESRPGEEEGVYLALSVRQEEYLDFVPSAGMRVIFHDPNAQVIPEVMGNDIAPGYLTQMRIYKTTINRISTPSSKCISKISDLASSTPFYYNGSYSSEACLRSIVQSSIVNTCGCASPMYALPPSNVAQSCQLAQLSCVANFSNGGMLESVASHVTMDECPELCSEIQYDVSRVFSLLTTPSPYCLAAAYSNMSCDEFTQLNLAVVRAFYSQLYHLTYTEYLALTATQLVSSFGGLLGLFFGMSVIACVECVFCAYEAIVIIYKKLHGRCVTAPPLPGGATQVAAPWSNETFYLRDEAKERKHILMSDVHGLRRVGTANSWWWLRLFWLACMITSGSLLILQLVRLIEDYEQYQTNVDIQITEGALQFPAMTFCDLNPYKKSLMQNIAPAEALIKELNQSPFG